MYPGPSCPDCPFSIELDDTEINTQIKGGPRSWDDTLHFFTGVQWDGVRATNGVSAKAYVWKMALG
jgi:hypothetical protein